MAAASSSDRPLLQRVACSPINYWAAMVTDVVAAAVLAWLGAVWYSGPPIIAVFLVLGGLLSWGFLEYLLHRWILHGIFSAIRKEHARHHGQPRAPIATPWLVIPACATLTCATLSIVMSPGAAALATFRESTAASMGMRTLSSHAAKASPEMPEPSLPNTTQQSP